MIMEAVIMSENKVLAVVPKNAAEAIVIQATEFNGKKAVDIRTFWVDGDNLGGPTKKGVNIPLAAYPAFKKALMDAEANMVKLGVIDQEDLDV
jgi:hypothetical protein